MSMVKIREIPGGRIIGLVEDGKKKPPETVEKPVSVKPVSKK